MSASLRVSAAARRDRRAGGRVVGVERCASPRRPRPRTATSAPRPMNFLTVSGVAATRVSTLSASVGTAIFMVAFRKVMTGGSFMERTGHRRHPMS